MKGKYLGEYAEAVFTAEAVKRGFRVCDPHGDSARYDKLVDCDGKLSRVQVKATSTLQSRSLGMSCDRYRTTMVHGGASGRTRYTCSEVDVLACFIEPMACWYLVPIDKVTSQHLYCYANGSSNEKYSIYKDNWEVFR